MEEQLTAILYLLAAADEASIATIYHFLTAYLSKKYPADAQPSPALGASPV